MNSWRINVRENWYRDVWMLVITGVTVLALWTAIGSIGRVQEGRSDAIRITCAVLTGVSQAGRDVIAAPAHTPETSFARALERLGYPPRKVRVRQADMAAAAYVQSIDDRVIAAVGARKARGVVRPDGQINCERLLTLSRAH